MVENQYSVHETTPSDNFVRELLLARIAAARHIKLLPMSLKIMTVNLPAFGRNIAHYDLITGVSQNEEDIPHFFKQIQNAKLSLVCLCFTLKTQYISIVLCKAIHESEQWHSPVAVLAQIPGAAYGKACYTKLQPETLLPTKYCNKTIGMLGKIMSADFHIKFCIKLSRCTLTL